MTSHTLHEKKSTLALAAIMSIRMLGLFLILPVFSVYASHMAGATPTRMGLALGIYGLTQAAFQIPFGMASDHVGRKPIIIAGLLLLLIGSIVAALAQDIHLLIVGRALQGAGAIGSTVLALMADLTRDEYRSKAMAFMGLSIGFAFTIAMITGPLINRWFHLSGIFWTTAGLALFGIFLLITVIPKPPKPIELTDSTSLAVRLSSAFKNKQLLFLNWGIFSLHAILTAMFIAIPIILFHAILLPEHEQILLYLGVLTASFILALPLIVLAEKKRLVKPLFCAAVGVIFLVEVFLCTMTHTLLLTGILLFVFFTAFTLLEATLPSWVSKIAPIRHKGVAMGVYSSSQFFGIFVGGALGGFIYSHTLLLGIFIFCAIIALLWFVMSFFMQQPPYLSTLVLPLKSPIFEDSLVKQLSPLKGVAEIAAVPAEGLLYLKIDKQKISENELRDAIRAGNLIN